MGHANRYLHLGGSALRLLWFISVKRTEKDECCCREKLLNSYGLKQIRIKAGY